MPIVKSKAHSQLYDLIVWLQCMHFDFAFIGIAEWCSMRMHFQLMDEITEQMLISKMQNALNIIIHRPV